MTFAQLKNKVCCLQDRLAALEQNGTGGSSTSGSKITSPDVSTLDDSRGVVGDWSYNATLNGGTYFMKVSVSPDAWISWSVASA